MTQKEIISGNKLIAEFMGLAYCEKYLYEGWYKNSEFNYRICSKDGLKYHESLDWLMPVIDKIRNSNFVIFFYAFHNKFGCEIAPTKQFIIDIKKPFPFFELKSETLSLPMIIFKCITRFLISYNGVKDVNIDLKSIMLQDVKSLSYKQREVMDKLNVKNVYDFIHRFPRYDTIRFSANKEEILIHRVLELLCIHCVRFHDFNIKLLLNQTIE